GERRRVLVDRVWLVSRGETDDDHRDVGRRGRCGGLRDDGVLVPGGRPRDQPGDGDLVQWAVAAEGRKLGLDDLAVGQFNHPRTTLRIEQVAAETLAGAGHL